VVRAALAGTQHAIPEADRRQVASAVQRRQAEFIAGRWCAHQALRDLGRPAVALPTGSLRQPLWPDGAIGSITHEDAYCLAIVAPSVALDGIGIDLACAARADQLDGSSGIVLAVGERLPALAGVDAAGALLHVFGMKEAVVKAISAQVGRFMDLSEIRLAVDGDRFTATVAGLAPVRGRWSRHGDLVLSYAGWARG